MPAYSAIGSSSAGPGRVPRAAVLIACAVVFLAVFFILSGPSWPLALYRLSSDGAMAIAWLASAAGYGWVLWRLLMPRFQSPAENTAEAPSGQIALSFITCIALGLGVMSLLILGLGLLGWLDFLSSIVLVAIGAAISAAVAAAARKTWHPERWLGGKTNWGNLWILVMPLAAIVVLAAFFPPGLLWGDEPNGYDVAEYHLQVPREWFEAGKIVPLHHNVFSYMPFNVEMHYLLAMHLRGGPWAGMYLAQLMHLAMCALTAAAVYGLAGGSKPGILAVLAVAATPWTSLLAAVAYNDGATMLFGVLAIGWAIRAQNFRGFILAGLLAGFAGGAKLPILPLLLLGVPAALLLTSPHFNAPRVKLLARCIAYGVACMAALSPWLIRNQVWAGNPVFPEAMNTLGQAHFTDVQVTRWQRAYLPEPKYRDMVDRPRVLWEAVMDDWRYGYFLFPLGLLAGAMSFRERTTRYLLLLLLVQMLVWLLFTHVQSRFMVIIIPILALLIAHWPQSAGRTWMALGVLAMLVLTSVNIWQKTERFLQVNDTQFRLIGRENLEGFTMVDLSKIPPDKPIDLLGEARAFFYQVPMTRLHYKTVFDVDSSDPSRSLEDQWLWGMPKGVVVPNFDELRRLGRTYYGLNAATRPAG